MPAARMGQPARTGAPCGVKFIGPQWGPIRGPYGDSLEDGSPIQFHLASQELRTVLDSGSSMGGLWEWGSLHFGLLFRLILAGISADLGGDGIYNLWASKQKDEVLNALSEFVQNLRIIMEMGVPPWQATFLIIVMGDFNGFLIYMYIYICIYMYIYIHIHI